MEKNFKNLNLMKIIKELIIISLGCAIYSFAIMHFNVPNKLAEGGGTGIALLLLYAVGLPVSVGTILVNIPLLLIGYKMLDKKTMLYTVYGIFMLTFWIGVFEKYNIAIDIGGDRLIASVFGGILAGIGLGIVFLAGGTTGGVDIVANIIKLYTGSSICRIIKVLDGVIIALTFVVVKSFPAILYTLIYIFICTKMIDYVVEGGVPGKGVMIVSSEIELITKRIQEDMNRGLTYIKGQGSYSKKDLNIGYCVVSRNEIGKVKSIVYNIDPRAFVTITEVHDIIGEGFSFDQPKKTRLSFKSKL